MERRQQIERPPGMRAPDSRLHRVDPFLGIARREDHLCVGVCLQQFRREQNGWQVGERVVVAEQFVEFGFAVGLAVVVEFGADGLVPEREEVGWVFEVFCHVEGFVVEFVEGEAEGGCACAGDAEDEEAHGFGPRGLDLVYLSHGEVNMVAEDMLEGAVGMIRKVSCYNGFCIKDIVRARGRSEHEVTISADAKSKRESPCATRVWYQASCIEEPPLSAMCEQKALVLVSL